MKGVVFRSFLDFTETHYGLSFTDQMLEDTEPDSGGAYTNIGTYDHEELLAFVAYIAAQQNLDANELVRAFGDYLFGVLQSKHSEMVNCYQDSFECIIHLDETIHRNVRKIHPQAETPQMKVSLSNDNQVLHMHYLSKRPFFELSHGLLTGCVKHFGDQITIEPIKNSDFEGTFVLTKHD
ncbi:heme NO-binding domain-containing protein [Marinicella sediminis]|uniref:Heme NO-binding domain-containing protein n=1 Tax=Marinicella sediminis TaxID=1792834 RepID=A0ABV7JFT0_9GAMM|nr:heme NO-binding domain-containing protein [Marinicella sediminis]